MDDKTRRPAAGGWRVKHTQKPSSVAPLAVHRADATVAADASVCCTLTSAFASQEVGDFIAGSSGG